jgi:hypothetical protein
VIHLLELDYRFFKRNYDAQIVTIIFDWIVHIEKC